MHKFTKLVSTSTFVVLSFAMAASALAVDSAGGTPTQTPAPTHRTNKGMDPVCVKTKVDARDAALAEARAKLKEAKATALATRKSSVASAHGDKTAIKAAMTAYKASVKAANDAYKAAVKAVKASYDLAVCKKV